MSLKLPDIPITAFSQTDVFLIWIYREFRPPKESKRPITRMEPSFVSSTMLAHVDWNWPILWEKKPKNRPVCKNAVT